MATYVTLETLNGEKFKFPRILYNHAKEFKNKVENKLDVPIIITGAVGAGKTNLGIGFGGVWEEVLFKRPYTLDNLQFSAEKIVAETNRDDNYTHNIGFDEAVQGGTSKDGQSRVGFLLRKALVTKRFKGHFLTFCVDSLKELNDKIIERSAVWYDVYYIRTPSGKYRKGLVKVFNIREAMIVWKDLKERKYLKAQEHPIWKKNTRVYNTNDYMGVFFTEQEYNKKKSRETNLLLETDDKYKVQRDIAIVYCLKLGAKQKEIAAELGMSRSTIGDIKSAVTSRGKIT